LPRARRESNNRRAKRDDAGALPDLVEIRRRPQIDVEFIEVGWDRLVRLAAPSTRYSRQGRSLETRGSLA
jgi:hypothetical protein